jgi:predicted glycoside hydrolase/deacetylase ChbG (UPF0249 family)
LWESRIIVIRVIINADDFGLTEGVCRGIVRAIQAGGVTATTAMVCAPGAVERLRRWAPEVRGHIGAHLQLTSGAPVLPPNCVPSLVDDNGRFPSTRKVVSFPRTEEILAEWRAQIRSLLAIGIEPTHLDSHHHIHRLPAAFPAFWEVAREYRIPARAVDDEMKRRLHDAGVRCVDKTLTSWYGGDLSSSSLVQLLKESLREWPESDSFEVMCHPGIVDDDLAGVSRYTSDRERELAALCDEALPAKLEEAGFSLSKISFLERVLRPLAK